MRPVLPTVLCVEVVGCAGFEAATTGGDSFFIQYDGLSSWTLNVVCFEVGHFDI